MKKIIFASTLSLISLASHAQVKVNAELKNLIGQSSQDRITHQWRKIPVCSLTQPEWSH